MQEKIEKSTEMLKTKIKQLNSIRTQKKIKSENEVLVDKASEIIRNLKGYLDQSAIPYSSKQ